MKWRCWIPAPVGDASALGNGGAFADGFARIGGSLAESQTLLETPTNLLFIVGTCLEIQVNVAGSDHPSSFYFSRRTNVDNTFLSC